ncbi:PC4/YdbC family ssDNA-binding protein [Metasolibacillus sp. FSL H7-0170]|uniref:YdbC family protein n=1 Tax=Metasolibacillus TaxID=2703677 RepID=UPI000797E321|nr:PC4/YdbC family ssDNA-binding protein [Metasolibacillus fluoroglycofenilyticus]KYG92016.1 hypothetical protein A0U40_03495 [[Bacillus] sp. KCTC 13219]
MADTFKIEEQIATLRTAETGWTRELGKVIWYNKPMTIDVRWWSPDKSKAGKGISLTQEEARLLFFGLKELFERTEVNDY